MSEMPKVVATVVFAVVVGVLVAVAANYAAAQEKGPPRYLVHIETESPRDQVSVFNDWGSGVLVDPQYILTCNHNIEMLYTKISVHFQDKSVVEAEVVARDVVFDLAILKLKRIRYESSVEVSSQVRVDAGDKVTIWGYPGAGSGQATKYVVDVTPNILLQGGIRWAWFRVNERIDQGVSGGPVLIDGKLVGIERGAYLLSVGAVCVNTPQVRKILENIK